MSLPAPSTVAAALAELGLDVELVARRQDGQPLMSSDQVAVHPMVACADLDAGRKVSDDQTAETAALSPALGPLNADTAARLAPLAEGLSAQETLGLGLDLLEDLLDADPKVLRARVA